VVGQQTADIVDTRQRRCHGSHFWLSIYGVYVGATWQIRLNRPFAAAMRPYVKLLWPLVVITNPNSHRYPITPQCTECRLISGLFGRSAWRKREISLGADENVNNQWYLYC